MIVVGIVPSLNAEPKTLNEFLQPAVDELQALWNGVRLKTSLSSIRLTFRAALLCISADIPAARKLCGFKGHGAHRGCSRCLKEFPGGFGEKKDYSGFDRENWQPRTDKQHRANAKRIEKCTTVTGRNKLSQEFGINFWSSLLDLEYVDIIRCCSVDPMHNLFLGTAKYVFKLWDKQGIIGKKQMKELEKHIEEMDVPTDVGRLPKKISSNYGSYTAEQWKNWTLIYSMFALKDVIGDNHLRCWQTFVLACKYLCQYTVSTTDLQRADMLLVIFCKEFEKLYSKKSVTPNMHLHCNLKDIIMDHGPVHSYWCFSFERYNGIMGRVSTQKRYLVLQLMRKLILSRFPHSFQLPLQYQTEFEALMFNPSSSNEVCNDYSPLLTATRLHDIPTTIPIHSVNWADLNGIKLPFNYKIQTLEIEDQDALFAVYASLYPDLPITRTTMAETIKKYASVIIGNQRYSSKLECRSLRSARIYASWATTNEGALNLDTINFYAGYVLYFFSHSIKLNEKFVNHTFASVLWHKPDQDPDQFGNPTKTWKLNDFLVHGPSRFMPVQRIYCRFASAQTLIDGENKIVTVPLDRKLSCL